jgi:hypothetical protein
MTQEEQKLLFIDLSPRLFYGVKVDTGFNTPKRIESCRTNTDGRLFADVVDPPYYPRPYFIEDVKPYLRSLNTMTEEEAKEICKLSGIKEEDILTISVKEEYLFVNIDDGLSSSEVKTIWYEDMASSIALVDYLTSRHFDYRGLIPMGLAHEATKEIYKNL